MPAKLSGLITVAHVLLILAGEIESKVYGQIGPELYDEYGNYGGNHVVPVVSQVVDYYTKPQYAFGYEVDDYYNQLSHGRWEVRDGDVTQGQYRVLLPDGRIQIVSYIADKGGYRPTVTYIGKGHHPPPPPVFAKVHPPPVLQFHPTAAPPPPLPTPIVHEHVPFVSTTAAPYHHHPPEHHGGPYVHHIPQPHEIAGGPFRLDLSPHAPPGPVINVAGGHGHYPGSGYGDLLAYGPSSNHHDVVKITSPGKLARKRELMYDRTVPRSVSGLPEKRRLIKRKIRISRKTSRSSSPRISSTTTSTTIGTTSTTSTTESPLHLQ